MEREQLIRWDEIEPICVIRLLWHKLWLILLAALIGVMGSAMLLYVTGSSSYRCSANFSVASRAGSPTGYANVTAAKEAAAIYSELLQGRLTRDLISSQLESPVGTISAEQLGSTNLLKVSVTSASPRDALMTLQTITENLDTLSEYVSNTSVLTILSSPSLTTLSSRSMQIRGHELKIGVAAGAAMALLLAFLHVTGGTVQNRIGAKNMVDGELLSSIPHEDSLPLRGRSSKKKQKQAVNLLSPSISFGFSESIHRISARLEQAHTAGQQVFLFTSVSESEGKSTIAANTALSLAQRGQKVLFLDLDLRRPVQHKILGLEVTARTEFGKLLYSSRSPEAILDAAIHLGHTSLYALLSTHSYPDIGEKLSSDLMQQIVALARKEYDCVVIDTPPLGYFPDSEILSDLTDSTILVVRQDVVPAARINDAIDALQAGSSSFLGYVLNDMRHLSSAASPYGYGYGSRYYGKKYGKYGKYDRYSKYQDQSDAQTKGGSK